jgi:alkaline phosphatase D
MSATPACQFVEWVDHGYGIVHLTSESATFEYWWQDKLTPGSPDILGNQMIAFAADDLTQTPPRYRNQLDHVSLHGRAVVATAGDRTAEPAPQGILNPS